MKLAALPPARDDDLRDEALQLLEILSSERANQDSVAWAIFGTFSATTAILLVALFQDGPPVGVPFVVLSAVGCAFAIAWAIIQTRAQGRVDGIETRKKLLERALGYDMIEIPLAESLSFWTAFKNPRPGVKARSVMIAFPLVAAVIWAIAGVLALRTL